MAGSQWSRSDDVRSDILRREVPERLLRVVQTRKWIRDGRRALFLIRGFVSARSPRIRKSERHRLRTHATYLRISPVFFLPVFFTGELNAKLKDFRPIVVTQSARARLCIGRAGIYRGSRRFNADRDEPRIKSVSFYSEIVRYGVILRSSIRLNKMAFMHRYEMQLHYCARKV